MKTPFVKMHGNGNDFVIIDNIKQNFKKDKTLIKKITNRKIGIGCDQLILIEKSDVDKNDKIDIGTFTHFLSLISIAGNIFIYFF